MLSAASLKEGLLQAFRSTDEPKDRLCLIGEEWIPSISRQSSLSTDASDTDYLNTKASPELPRRAFPYASSPQFGRRSYHARHQVLPKVVEKQGWARVLLTRIQRSLSIPLMLCVGVTMGAVGMLLFLYFGIRFHTGTRLEYSFVPPPTEVPAEYLTSQPLNNSCLIPNIQFPPGPQNFDACAFVIQSTDALWNLRGDVDAAIDKYFHKDYYNAGSWGRRGVGKKALRDAVLSEMRAFPDIKIHITDCVCKGNDLDGYKCAMPDVLTGTNLGPSAYGPATGKYARWTGLVESIVQKDAETGQWQFVAEWGVHDEWALVQQLGLDFARVPHPPANTEPLHDCEPLVRFKPKATMDTKDKMEQNQAMRGQHT